MIDTHDTIVAVATAPGRGSRAMLRLSGPASLEIVRTLAAPLDGEADPPGFTGRAVEIRIGDLRFEAWAAFFRAPRSYTREDMVELTLPASAPLLDALLRRILQEEGARAAGPGEFTLRAFLNGRIDLSQAEAVAQLIAASDEQEARAARRGLEGELGRRAGVIAEKLREALALVEAALDFPDEDIEEISPERLMARIGEVEAAVEEIRRMSALRLSARGVFHVVLAGLPNAGKSSLLNRLVGRPAALVSPLEGTTRDPVKVEMERGGVRVVWVDIAGLPEGGGDETPGLEQHLGEDGRLALRRITQVEMDHADLVLWLLDPAGRVGASTERFRTLEGRASWLVVSKIDLLRPSERRFWTGHELAPCLVSARTGEGVEDLVRRVVEEAGGGARTAARLAAEAPRYLVSAHQEAALLRAAESARAAREALQGGLGLECAAADLRGALRALEDLVGGVTPGEILERVFSRFCIGK